MKRRLDRTNATHHVYRCYDVEGRLIYVGSTANLFGRLEQHRASSWWAGQVVQVTAKVYPNGIVGRAVERKAIRDEQPRWNKSGRWPTRHDWSRDQWDDWLTMLLARGSYVTELKRFLSLYERRWAEPAKAADVARVAVIEADAKRRADQLEVEHAAQRARWAEYARLERIELAEWRAERASRGIPADCICTDEEYAARTFCEDCNSDHALLETGVL